MKRHVPGSRIRRIVRSESLRDDSRQLLERSIEHFTDPNLASPSPNRRLHSHPVSCTQPRSPRQNEPRGPRYALPLSRHGAISRQWTSWQVHQHIPRRHRTGCACSPSDDSALSIVISWFENGYGKVFKRRSLVVFRHRNKLHQTFVPQVLLDRIVIGIPVALDQLAPEGGYVTCSHQVIVVYASLQVTALAYVNRALPIRRFL